MLQQFTTTLERQTAGRGLLEVTEDVSGWVAGSGCREGLLTLFVRHTSDLWEHRLAGHRQQQLLHLIGE